MLGSRIGTTFACLLALFGATALAQQQNIPDAPQPKAQQPAQFPEDAPPAPKNPRPEGPDPVASATPAPKPQPQGDGSDILATDLTQFPRIITTVNFVQLPVTVKDRSGRLVPGLTSNDFTVL